MSTMESAGITELSWQEAEEQFFFRLDRRRRYATDGMHLLELSRWTEKCFGCACDCGDGYGCSHLAVGCQECGYTGKRRISMWQSHAVLELLRKEGLL